MSDTMPMPPLPEPPAKKPMSSNQKWLMGCGIGCLVMTLVLLGGCAILGFFAKKGIDYIKQQVEIMSQDFIGRGYEQMGSIATPEITITDQASGKKLYIATSVDISADCDSDIAIIATDARISGRVAGAVHFRGQQIVIEPTGVIEGDLDVSAVTVIIEGAVNGKVQGVYSHLSDGAQTP
ncbi:MAG: polymer-forming cytoskeletal protein [Spartobacteria bacterium]|nr:polymer-forming cytoskeletal protein [Spartobacteria bacterium]